MEEVLEYHKDAKGKDDSLQVNIAMALAGKLLQTLLAVSVYVDPLPERLKTELLNDLSP